MGANVSVASVIGDDENGTELTKRLQDINVNTDNLIVETNRKTSKKSRIIAANQQIVRYDKESKNDISDKSVKILKNKIESEIQHYDAVILSDYGKGVLTVQLTQYIIHLAKKYNKKVFVDPKGYDYTKYKGAYTLTPNKKEASEATGIDLKNETSLQEALYRLKQICELEVSLITLSEDGIAIYDEQVKHFPTAAKEVYDVTGAGDTVIASLAFAISSGIGIEQAINFANLAAGVVVSKIGSATATIDEIEEYESSLHKSSSDSHIKNFEEIERFVKRFKKQGKRIVFTNGCFDILHIGHVKYLQEAKSFGDVLIVGLNSDESVRRLKGSTRPVNSVSDRAYLLAALETVDYVVPFEDDTPYELIKLINPHVLVKGGDYKDKNVVGIEFADELRLVHFVEGKSTTGTIKKILGEVC